MLNTESNRRIILYLAVTLDEFRLSIHPVILGDGKPMFIDIKQRLNIKLINTNKFSSGVVYI